MSMRIPKLKGFRNPNKETFAIINVESLNRFAAGAVVNPDELRKRGLIKHHGRVKVLAEGDLDRALTVQAHAFSAAARDQDRSRRRHRGGSRMSSRDARRKTRRRIAKTRVWRLASGVWRLHFHRRTANSLGER